MSEKKFKMLRRQLKKQYWSGMSKKPKYFPWFLWEWLMKRAYFSFFK